MALTTSTSWFHQWSPPPIFTHQAFDFPQSRNHYKAFAHHSQNVYKEPKNIKSEEIQFEHVGIDAQHPPKHVTVTNSTSTSMIKYFPYLVALGIIHGQDSKMPALPLQSPLSVEDLPSDIPPFRTVFAWKQIDLQYPTLAEKTAALKLKKFVVENNLPLGVEVYKDRLFLSLPKWKKGVPASLGFVPISSNAGNISPKISPYPSWDWHDSESCMTLTSVYRMQADECDRLWVMDSGQIDVLLTAKQVCPPTLFIFDLKTDTLLLRYPLPEAFIKEDSLYSNIRVDVREGKCGEAFAYMTDVWRFGLVVFSLEQQRSWRVTDHLFFPDPLASAYNLQGLDFEWTDGIFGMALSPYNKMTQDRIMYFHPMSSFREFYVRTSVIRNETGWRNVKDAFKVMGQSRGQRGHTSASAMDRNGILFFPLVTRNSVGCWDSRKPYKRQNLGVIAQDNVTLLFPNDLKIDNEKKQSVWLISNKLPIYLYDELNKSDYNFRVLTAFSDEAIKYTICDPNLVFGDSYEHYAGEEDCQ